jgi:hypothetical protein
LFGYYDEECLSTNNGLSSSRSKSSKYRRPNGEQSKSKSRRLVAIESREKRSLEENELLLQEDISEETRKIKRTTFKLNVESIQKK